MPVAGTSGEAYLAGRGIPIDIAIAAGVRCLERLCIGGQPEPLTEVDVRCKAERGPR